MHPEHVLALLRQVGNGELSPEQALAGLGSCLRDQSLKGLTLDHGRGLRTGLGEVVFAQGKSRERLLAAMDNLARSGPVLATRLSSEQGQALCERFPHGSLWPEARVFAIGPALGEEPAGECLPDEPEIAVLTAGASDMPVALEAYGSALFFGIRAALVCDVGVAGIHRLAPYLDMLAASRLLIVCAGMEGALPSVVSGLTGRPILAVPTSVGYGVSANGYAALLSMLSSCAPGIATMNIDNGFGAAAMARKLLDA